MRSKSVGGIAAIATAIQIGPPACETPRLTVARERLKVCCGEKDSRAAIIEYQRALAEANRVKNTVNVNR